jgi:restriction system protein
MNEITAQDLRTIVGLAISKTIDLHRASRQLDEGYLPPIGAPTEQEISDFIFHNILLDDEIVLQIIDPSLLGYSAMVSPASDDWLEEFKENIDSWAENYSWIGADEPLRKLVVDKPEPSETAICKPSHDPLIPSWVDSSPSYIQLAQDLLSQGRTLCELHWRNFENLIGELLEGEGWTVKVTRQTRDGGIDLVAVRLDTVIGEIKSVWQAKKYGPANKVKLHEVRELSAIRDDQRATKAIMVTTSHLTKDAIEWVKRDIYRLSYRDKDYLERWLLEYPLRLK